jgi:hypothetical protein
MVITMGVLSAVERNEIARDIMQHGRFESKDLRDGIVGNGIAIEKIGAAGILAAEKIGAASLLAAEKIGAANSLAIHQNFASLQLQACNNHAQAMAASAQCCCEIKELIHLDGQKTRDLVNNIERDRTAVALMDAKQEVLLAKLSRGNGHD